MGTSEAQPHPDLPLLRSCAESPEAALGSKRISVQGSSLSLGRALA